jgi:hypothetical protein
MSAEYFTVTVDCPICMDCIEGNTNKVTTECGHCFHTNCLMTSVAHNGFGCPYCRTVMAEEPEEPEDSDDENMSNVSFEDSINSSMHGLTEDEYNDYLTLTSIRRLFREEGDEDEEEDEEEEEEAPKPSIEFIAQKLREQGFTMERMVKAWLMDHDEYDDIEEDCLQEADNIFEAMRILISNFTPEQGQQAAPAQAQEEEQAPANVTVRRGRTRANLNQAIDRQELPEQGSNRLAEIITGTIMRSSYN